LATKLAQSFAEKQSLKIPWRKDVIVLKTGDFSQSFKGIFRGHRNRQSSLESFQRIALVQKKGGLNEFLIG